VEKHIDALGKNKNQIKMKQSDLPETNSYKKNMTIFWWIHRKSYLRFIARELTSLPVAFFTIELVFLIKSLSQSPESYAEFQNTMRSPVFTFLNFFALAGILFHSLSWFSLSAKAMVIKVGRIRLPGIFIILMNYVGWMFISALIFWLILS
jgi:fumarate reductase subunit C